MNAANRSARLRARRRRFSQCGWVPQGIQVIPRLRGSHFSAGEHLLNQWRQFRESEDFVWKLSIKEVSARLNRLAGVQGSVVIRNPAISGGIIRCLSSARDAGGSADTDNRNERGNNSFDMEKRVGEEKFRLS